MTKYNDLDFDYFDKAVYIDYSSLTGLRWKIDNRYLKKIKAGTQAGTVKKNGYAVLHFKGKMYFVHRVIYLLEHKEIDSYLQIDHIDGNKLNNDINNLREVTVAVNNRNAKLRSDNKSGVKGVYYRRIEEHEYWVARYSDDETGKLITKYFGIHNYKSSEDAKIAAIKFRELKIDDLILKGSGYTERHNKGLDHND